MQLSLHLYSNAFEQVPGAAERPLSASSRAAYTRHRPEQTPLYPLVLESLATLLARACERTEHGYGYPRHVRRTFEAYLACGMPQAGFSRVRCTAGCCRLALPDAPWYPVPEVQESHA